MKKLLIGLGGVSLLAMPALAMVSCSTTASTPNPQDEIFGDKDGTVEGLYEYFTQTAPQTETDKVALAQFSGLNDLKLDRELMKTITQPINPESCEKYLVKNSLKEKFKLENYAVTELGVLYNTIDYYRVGDPFNPIATTQLNTEDQAYYKDPKNWKPEPTTPETPEEAWLSMLDSFEKTIDAQYYPNGFVDKKYIASSFGESRLRKLGLLKNDEAAFPFNTKDQDPESLSLPLRLTEKGELFVIANNLSLQIKLLKNVMAFHREVGFEQMQEDPNTWTGPNKVKYDALFKEQEESVSLANQNFNVSSSLNIKNDELPIIETIILKDSALTIETFNAYTTINEKLDALNITFVDSKINPSAIKDIVLTKVEEKITATITWGDLLLTEVGSKKHMSDNPSAQYITIPKGIKLYRQGFTKWNDVTKTSKSVIVTFPPKSNLN